MLIATAGHVDHGKTSLVQSITGVDTDRLPEEKNRGLSIDIGFAYERLGTEEVFGFVDVPGHERFVRNMLAGVGAIDVALLVIAADDGPMPQTREHLAILDLLAIRAGAVAINKIDLVDPARVDEVRNQTTAMLAGTSLENAQLFSVSGQTGQGVSDLKAHLLELGQTLPPRETGGRFRLAIDRNFTVRGAGLVVTGAVFSGKVANGDRVTLAPSGVQVRIRSIHAQNEAAEDGTVGERCALNLSGTDLGRVQLQRGDWLVGDPAPEPTRRIDADLRVLASEERPLKHWTPVHVHLGAGSFTGRIAVLEGREIAPGESGRVQVVLDQETVAVKDDRFIVRDQSARRTMAGGSVIDPFGAARGRAKPERLAYLDAMGLGSPSVALAQLLEQEHAGVDVESFAQAWNLTSGDRDKVLAGVDYVETPIRRQRLSISTARWDGLRAHLLKELGEWHDRYPERIGPDESELRRSAADLASRDLVTASVAELVRAGTVARQGLSLRLASHEAKLSPQDAATWKALGKFIHAEELKPPVVTELANQLSMEKERLVAFLARAVGRGQLVRIAPNRFYDPQAVRRLAEIAEEVVSAGGQELFDAKMYRDASGIGRNLTIQVLEYFDQHGYTRRIGDERRLIKTSEEVFGRPG
ncbi:MAG: selenocysteine-specific translation elongation factor [Gammaproteobacteria bacterium]|nr:selenocysteine-specific translation elongation factor [Gammaproteobacteria bacterium]